MLDWLIVGGGVHGTHLSHVLTGRLGWPRDRVRVLDPHATPLARWNGMTANVGMDFMRSSLVHHLDLDPYALKRFAKTPDGQPAARFARPYNRPAYALFQHHARCVVRQHRLGGLRVRGRARGLQRAGGGWLVETKAGTLEARRVLLALGLSEQPCWPDWARALRAAGGPVHHLFDETFQREALPGWRHAVVVGGGISAVQVALALADRQPGSVTLLARHEARVHHLDSDPGWMGPKRLATFSRQPCSVQRRSTIDRARHRGSVPPAVQRRLGYAVAEGRLAHRIAEVADAETGPAGLVRLRLGAPPGALAADLVVLATGFEAQRPGGPWLDAAVEALGLRCSVCGYPVTDAALRWADGLYVTGPLAELALGPVARNIVGARLAAERLAHAA
ncbi:MAG: FAD/NAD(P)-binding protein [Bacteroidota bacterium]